MRNYLLASAALFGLTAGAAQAATLPTTDAAGILSAWNAPKTTPDPGKIIVRLSGGVWFDAAVASSTVDKGLAGTANAGAKNQTYGLSGFFRLYFGVDGRMTNGLIYGANAEMRTNFAGSQAATYTGTATLSNGSANSTASLWYTRRAFVYLGGDSWGIVRMGANDGPLGIFNESGTTTGEAFSTGGWDGDLPDFLGNGALSWPFLDTGNEYATNKITYMTPNLNGFMAGVSFAPSSATLSANSGSNAASGGFDRQSASTLAADLGRPRNTYEIGARYMGPLGPVSAEIFGGYYGSNVIKNAAGPAAFRSLSVFDAGVSATFAGFTPFGHIEAGKFNNGSMGLEAKVPGRSKDGLAWVAGAQYGQGPYTVGASYYSFDSLGSAAGTGNSAQKGIAVGGSYVITKGLTVFAEYIYGTKHQNGVNFIDPAGPATQGNKITSSAAGITVAVGW